jgi:hypothetical protein
MTKFDEWLSAVEGKFIDMDGVFGSQCVDVSLHYVKFLYGVHWINTLGTGDAKDLYAAASSKYFEKIPYTGQQAQQGDLIVWDATNYNPYGHIAVCIQTNGVGMMLMEQDGFIDTDNNGNADGVTYRKFRPYSNNIIGFLRPRILMSRDATTKEEIIDLHDLILDGKPGANFNYDAYVGKRLQDVIALFKADPTVQRLKTERTSGVKAFSFIRSIYEQIGNFLKGGK